MSAVDPDAWEAARSRVTAQLARREAVLAETAVAWARFARAQGWSGHDVEVLWEGLTEDLVRRYAAGATAVPGTRDDVLTVMAALRARIAKELGE